MPWISKKALEEKLATARLVAYHNHLLQLTEDLERARQREAKLRLQIETLQKAPKAQQETAQRSNPPTEPRSPSSSNRARRTATPD
jgi:hypothetical protein